MESYPERITMKSPAFQFYPADYLADAKVQALSIEGEGGTCAICKKAHWNGKAPFIDHDHKTEKVRGVLCNSCNMALGFLRDNIEIAQGVVEYLKKFNQRREIE